MRTPVAHRPRTPRLAQETSGQDRLSDACRAGIRQLAQTPHPHASPAEDLHSQHRPHPSFAVTSVHIRWGSAASTT